VSIGGTLTTGSVTVGSKGVTVGSSFERSLTAADLDIKEILGAGSSGCVSRCIHKKTGQVLALKEIKLTNENHISEIQKVSSDILASDGQLLTNVMREDKDPHESGVFTDVLLEAMPKEEKGFLKVKKILNQE
ncbi:hypothetical protein IIC45_00975, partial [Patescibacteria group bacterium]|nr:hypothetical protein [Patescibacteria group bacterium]